jgi:hypothetical protein
MCERSVSGVELYLCVRTRVERDPKQSPGAGSLRQRRVVRRSEQHPHVLGGLLASGAPKGQAGRAHGAGGGSDGGRRVRISTAAHFEGSQGGRDTGDEKKAAVTFWGWR